MNNRRREGEPRQRDDDVGPSQDTGVRRNSLSPLLQAALEYGRRGWPVVPLHGVVLGHCTCGSSECSSPGKHPLSQHGVKDATTDEAPIRAWWGRSAQANIGIATGRDSGLVVLDVDPEHGGDESLADLEQRHGRLPSTPEQITGGGGRHILFAHPGNDVSNRVAIAPGLDMRADGGYIVAAPSLHVSGGHYAWEASRHPDDLLLAAMPRWLVETSGTAPSSNGTGERLETADVLAGVPEGERDKTLFRLACRLRHADVPREWAERLVLDAAANCSPPFSERDAVAKVESAYNRYEAGQGTPTRSAYRGSQVGEPLPLLTISELRERYSGEVDWIVEGYLARGELAFLTGAGESLKSWMVTDLAFAVATSTKWLGVFEVSAERVLFLEQERAGNFLYQFGRIETAERVSPDVARLKIVPPVSIPLSELAAQQALEDAIISFRPDVVIVNALRDVLGRANENSPTDMAALLGPLGQMAEKYHCCVLLLDHFNKLGLSGAVRGNAAHGGTAHKHAEADVILVAERPRDEMGKAHGPATVSVTKRRSAEPGKPFSVSVEDTADGGVLVRAELDVPVLSQGANAVYKALADGPALVAELALRTSLSKDTVRQDIGELRGAGLVEGKGPIGKAYTYWRKDSPLTCDSPIGSQVGTGEANEPGTNKGGHLLRLLEEQGFPVLTSPQDTEGAT